MVWAVEDVDSKAVDLVHGDYRATLYGPTGFVMDGYADVDFGARKLRPLYSGTLGTLPDAIKGDFRRSVHRPALQALVSEWSPTALALLVHAVQGTHSPWCTLYRCPLAPVQDSTAG